MLPPAAVASNRVRPRLRAFIRQMSYGSAANHNPNQLICRTNGAPIVHCANAAPLQNPAQAAILRRAMASLEIRGVSKHFGAILALDDVSLTLRGGEVIGLMGDNGAASRPW